MRKLIVTKTPVVQDTVVTEYVLTGYHYTTANGVDPDGRGEVYTGGPVTPGDPRGAWTDDGEWVTVDPDRWLGYDVSAVIVEVEDPADLEDGIYTSDGVIVYRREGGKWSFFDETDDWSTATAIRDDATARAERLRRIGRLLS